jgi:pimeloyl-ACP methyl ester carboxylesterase
MPQPCLTASGGDAGGGAEPPELHEGIPGSELVVLEDSGHFGHVEEPDAFARAVVGFVASTGA